MNIIKTGILGLSAVLCALLVKEQKPQFSLLISLAACILISYNAIFRLKTLSDLFESLMAYTAMKSSYFLILMKIGSQIEIFAKVAVLTVSAPVMLAVFQTVTEFLA